MSRPELIARGLVAIGMAALGIPFALHERSGVIDVHARMPEAGGWSPQSLEVVAGETLRLRVTSDDVMHGFAVGGLEMEPVDLEPGRATDVDLLFTQPGRYTYYCTRWCGPNHWRMRGTIEVLPMQDGSSEVVGPPEGPPLYVELGIDIDSPHPAETLPARLPSSSNGRLLAAGSLPGSYLEPAYYRSHSPSAAFADLRAEALPSLTDSEIWDLVAYIWEMNTMPAKVQAGRALYAENCAACHGQGGAGDGIFSAELLAAAEAWTAASMTASSMDPQPPADFTDPSSMLGASPALLQGKILRGGMGTSMPMWGSILNPDQIEDVVAHLYTFQFQESTE